MMTPLAFLPSGQNLLPDGSVVSHASGNQGPTRVLDSVSQASQWLPSVLGDHFVKGGRAVDRLARRGTGQLGVGPVQVADYPLPVRLLAEGARSDSRAASSGDRPASLPRGATSPMNCR